ncbi:MAG: tetratricopeptide repeat protein [Sandaracinaceae bacterium]|nr:tetratricopeptide repeat protein [Sandaracinaceae bacterium]
MSSRMGWWASVLALVLLVPCEFARAQQPASEEEARALFVAGRVAFDEGRFEDAHEYFTRSYELSHRPELLYNIGTCADRLGHQEEALEVFREYVAQSPESPKRAQVEARIAVLEQQVAERRALEARAGQVPTPEQAARMAEQRDGPPGADLSREDERGSNTGLIVGLAVGGAVVVAAVVVMSVVLSGREGAPQYGVRGDSGNVILTLRSAP